MTRAGRAGRGRTHQRARRGRLCRDRPCRHPFGARPNRPSVRSTRCRVRRLPSAPTSGLRPSVPFRRHEHRRGTPNGCHHVARRRRATLSPARPCRPDRRDHDIHRRRDVLPTTPAAILARRSPRHATSVLPHRHGASGPCLRPGPAGNPDRVGDLRTHHAARDRPRRRASAAHRHPARHHCRCHHGRPTAVLRLQAHATECGPRRLP
jgi:hypothetical protein